MSTQATHALKDNGPATILYMALELSSKTWKVMFGGGGKQRTLDLPARDLPALMAAMGEAREKFGLPGDCKVASCYEAGRDGFWIHRALEAQKVENLVIDSSAIEVNRRAKKVKTDGIDVVKLLGLLRRYHGGDPKVFSVVRVPSREAEDDRHLMRELECLKGERTQHRNRIGSYLINLGLKIGKISGKTVKAEVAVLTDHAGLKVPAHTAAQIVREGQRLLLVEQQMLPLLKERRARERAARMALQAEAAAKAKSVHAGSEPAATAGMAPVGQAMAVPAPASGTSQADTTALVVARTHAVEVGGARDRLDAGPGILRLADVCQPARSGGGRRSNAHALCERRQPARAGSEQGGQPPGSGDDGRGVVDVAAPSARVRTLALVQAALCQWRRAGPQGRDRGHGQEAAHRSVAVGELRRDPARRGSEGLIAAADIGPPSLAMAGLSGRAEVQRG